MLDPTKFQHELDGMDPEEVRKKLLVWGPDKLPQAKAHLEECKRKEAVARENERDERQDFRDNTARKDAKDAKRISIGAVLVTILSVVVGALYSHWSLEFAERSLRISERAYIGMESISLGVMKPGVPVRVVVKFANDGKTPARGVKIYNNVWLRQDPLPLNPRFGEYEGPVSESTISSGKTADSYFSAPQVLTQEQIDLIHSGGATIYVYGRVDYFDIFRQPHFQKFCGYYVSTKERFDVCPHHNESD